MIEVKMNVAAAEAAVAMSVEAGFTMADVPAYDGPYEFTPSGETQVISIEGRRASQDITIRPVPSGYGRITWNGAVLTVS